MAKDVSDTVRDVLTSVAREAMKNAGGVAPTKKKSGPLAGGKGVAAGVGLAALAPFAAKKGMDAVRSNGSLPSPNPAKLAPTKLASKAASKAGDKVGSKVKDAVSSKVDEAGGAGGLAKQAASGLLPGGGGDDDGGKNGMPGVGKGRRMPVQQSIDVAVPIETAYNQWTQYEDWPEFMHRVTRVTQEDECTVSFATKIWGKTKEFTAEIETQRPDERVKWRVTQGITHTGVVSFHELAPKLTRIEVTLDVDPGSLIEKAARGMRHIKRAVRADLARFKAFIEVMEHETGAWRGVIEDGEIVEEHDDSYDEKREYADIDDIYELASTDEDEDEDEDDDSDDSQKGRTQRFKRQAERTTGRKSSSSSSSSRGSGSSSRGSGSSSRASGSSSRGSSSSKNGSGSSKSGSSSSKRGSSSSSRKTAAASKPRASRTASGSGSSKRSSGSGSSKRSSSSSSTKRKPAARS